jgi:hypothetical protein
VTVYLTGNLRVEKTVMPGFPKRRLPIHGCWARIGPTHTDPLFYRIFQERPATVFELAGLAVPPAGVYRMHAEEMKQTAFRLDGVLLPAPGTPGLPLVFAESQFYADPWFYAR